MHLGWHQPWMYLIYNTHTIELCLFMFPRHPNSYQADICGKVVVKSPSMAGMQWMCMYMAMLGSCMWWIAILIIQEGENHLFLQSMISETDLCQNLRFNSRIHHFQQSCLQFSQVFQAILQTYLKGVSSLFKASMFGMSNFWYVRVATRKTMVQDPHFRCS